jgi:hypothetical protein
MVDIQLTVAQEGILMRMEVKVEADTLLRTYTGCRMESRRFGEYPRTSQAIWRTRKSTRTPRKTRTATKYYN